MPIKPGRGQQNKKDRSVQLTECRACDPNESFPVARNAGYVNIAGGFVQKNISQIQKKLIFPKRLENPVVLTEFDDSARPDYAMAEAAESTIEKIIAEHGEKTSILLIGRYNYDSYKICRTDRFYDLPGIRGGAAAVLCRPHPHEKPCLYLDPAAEAITLLG
jgi:hypothetical protein